MRYRYRPWVFVVAGFAVAALLDVACPHHSEAQIDNPRGTVTIVRRLNATDQEAQEGYFALGVSRQDGLMIVVDPKTDMADFLRAKVGRMVKVVIEDAE